MSGSVRWCSSSHNGLVKASPDGRFADSAKIFHFKWSNEIPWFPIEKHDSGISISCNSWGSHDGSRGEFRSISGFVR